MTSLSPRSARVSAGAAAIAAGGLVVLVLAVLVRLRWDPLQDVDDGVGSAAYDAVRDSSTLRSLARALTHLGDPVVVTVATILLAAVLLVTRQTRAAVYVVAVRLALVVVNAALKTTIERARPDQSDPIAVAHGYSFPSGHSAGSAALWCSLAIVVGVRAPRAVVVALAAVVPVAVAATRVLLGVHFLSDVVAGLVVGVEVAVLLAVTFRVRTVTTGHDADHEL